MTDPVIRLILNFAIVVGMGMSLFLLIYLIAYLIRNRPWRRRK